MPDVERAAIETTLAYEDETAGRLMQREGVAAPQFWTVGQTIDHLRRESEELPELFFDVYVVDPAYKPVGAAPVSHLLRSKRDVPLAQIMEPVTEIPVDMDQEEVAYIFTKYHLISAPVVQPGGRLPDRDRQADGAGGADACRLLARRQRRHPGADRGGARHRQPRAEYRQRRAGDPPRAGRRPVERGCDGRPAGIGRLFLVARL